MSCSRPDIAIRIPREEYVGIDGGARASTRLARARACATSPGSSASSWRESRHEHVSESRDDEDARDGTVEVVCWPPSLAHFCASRQCARKDAILLRSFQSERELAIAIAARSGQTRFTLVGLGVASCQKKNPKSDPQNLGTSLLFCEEGRQLHACIRVLRGMCDEQ